MKMYNLKDASTGATCLECLFKVQTQLLLVRST